MLWIRGSLFPLFERLISWLHASLVCSRAAVVRLLLLSVFVCLVCNLCMNTGSNTRTRCCCCCWFCSSPSFFLCILPPPPHPHFSVCLSLTICLSLCVSVGLSRHDHLWPLCLSVCLSVCLCLSLSLSK